MLCRAPVDCKTFWLCELARLVVVFACDTHKHTHARARTLARTAATTQFLNFYMKSGRGGVKSWQLRAPRVLHCAWCASRYAAAPGRARQLNNLGGGTVIDETKTCCQSAGTLANSRWQRVKRCLWRRGAPVVSQTRP